MEKDINTEVSNTQLPATEEKANLKESLRIQKSQWIKEQIKRQREAEDAVLEQMIEEQRVIDGLNSDINENLDRTRESRKFNQEFQEKINTQIYEMNGITEDKLKGMREYKNAYYQGCAFSLFLLSVVMIGICGVLHGFESQICLFMIACTGVEGALLAQDKWRNKLVNILCKQLYLMVFPVMMVIQLRALEREEAAREKEEKLQSKKAEKEARKQERREKRQAWLDGVKEKWHAWVEKIKEKWNAFLAKFKKEE